MKKIYYRKYTLIKELSDGRKKETPIATEQWVLIQFKKELANLKEGEKIAVITNYPSNTI